MQAGAVRTPAAPACGSHAAPRGPAAGLPDDAVAAVTGQVEAYGDEPPEYRFHAGKLVAADVGLGVQRELLVHGWDLAKTMDRSWPVTRRQVSLIWSG